MEKNFNGFELAIIDRNLRKKFVVLTCINGESQALSKMKFVQLDMCHS